MSQNCITALEKSQQYISANRQAVTPKYKLEYPFIYSFLILYSSISSSSFTFYLMFRRFYALISRTTSNDIELIVDATLKRGLSTLRGLGFMLQFKHTQIFREHPFTYISVGRKILFSFDLTCSVCKI